MARRGRDTPVSNRGNYEAGAARKMLPTMMRASSQRQSSILTRLCFVTMLLAVVAIGKASCSAHLQDPSRADAPQSSALQSSEQTRESIDVITSDTSEIDHFSGTRDFNFTRLYFFVYFVYTIKPIPSSFVLNEASELMHSMTQIPTNISYAKVIGEILLGAFKIDKEYIIDHQDTVLKLMQDAKQALLAIPFPVGNDSVLVGNDMQIALLRMEEKPRDPDITLCSRGDKESPLERIIDSNYISKQSPNDKCNFAMTISNSRFHTAKIAVLAYPLNWTIRPLPLKENPIYNSRVVDVALTSTKMDVPGNQIISIFFKPSSNVGLKKGCSYWNREQDRWTTEGCWVELEMPDVCHCNLSAHLNEDAKGGQYIVYEYEDVFFNTSSYEYLLEHASEVSADFFFSEASSLMHNISLLTGSKITHVRLPELLLKALRIASQLPDAKKTHATMKNIERFYLNTRNVLKSLKHLPSLEIRNNVLIIFRKIESIQDSGISFTLQNNFNVKYTNHSLINNYQSTIQDAEVTYALTASQSVAEQNKNIVYVLFPTDRFLFRPIKNVGHFQVHNFRVVDITLVPRGGVGRDEEQFIDIFYKPSVTNTFAKNVQLGCAYWSNRDSNWTTEGCVVHVNATPRGCRCSLSAHFDENREGGQYVVYEYSDVILDFNRVESLEQYIGIEFYQDYRLIEELVTFLHNMTQIGYLSTDSLQYATVIAMRVLSFNQPVLKYAAKFLEPMLTDLHYMVYSWGSDDSAHYSNLFGTYFHGIITSPFAVSLEANDVLSNEVIRTKSSLLHQIVYFVTRLGLPLSNIGVQVTSEKTTYFKTPESYVQTGESQLTYYFSVDPADKVRFTVVMYPNSKSYLPLYGSLPAIFSCHVLDVTLISEDISRNSSLQSSMSAYRKFTLVYDSGEPRSSHVWTACAAWTRFGWSSKSCWSEKSNRHACTCNLTAHALSNGTFLPLLIYESPVEANFSPKSALSGLDILYLIFSTASLIGLVLIGVIAVTFPQWRADIGHKILLHMSLALFLYQSLRIFRETHHVYTAINRDVEGFVAFAAVTHYSRLAHYCWMLIMAWLQLRRLITMVGAADIPHLLLKVSFVGWGVPLIPLTVLLSWNREEHFAQPNLPTHLSLYLVPGGVVTIVNVFILIIILARLFSCFGWGETEDLARHGISGGKLTRRRLATAVLLVFLFGLPTVFEMANDFWGHSLTLEILFKVFDPVRGAVVFVYFILLDKKTFDMWHQKVRSLTSSNATQETDLF